MRGMEIVTIYCSSQITPGHVLEKLYQVRINYSYVCYIFKLVQYIEIIGHCI